MLGLAEGSIADVGQSARAKRVAALLRRAFADDAGVFNPKKFGDTLMKATPEDAVFLLLDRAVNVARDLYPIKRTAGVSDAIDLNNKIKGYQAVYEHMGYMPGVPIRNAINSVVIGTADGFTPFNKPSTIARWWERIGATPVAATRGFMGGPAGQFLDLKKKWDTAQNTAEELARPSTMERIRAAGKTAATGPALKVMGLVEKGFNSQAVYAYARTTWENLWTLGRGVSDAAVARLQSRAGDTITDSVVSDALNAMNARELDAIGDAFKTQVGAKDSWRRIGPDLMVRLRGLALSDPMVEIFRVAKNLDDAASRAKQFVNQLWNRSTEIGDFALPKGSHAADQASTMKEIIEAAGGYESLPRGVRTRLRNEATDNAIARNGRLLSGARNEALYWVTQSGDEGLASRLKDIYYRSEDVLEVARTSMTKYYDEILKPRLSQASTRAGRNRIWTEALNIRDTRWGDAFQTTVDDYADITRQARELLAVADASRVDDVILYRARVRPTTGPGLPGWVEEARNIPGTDAQSAAQAEGRWFTDRLELAQQYLRDMGQDAEIVQVRVPKEIYEQFRVSNLPADHPARGFVANAGDRANTMMREFFLPREFADAVAPLGSSRQVNPVVANILSRLTGKGHIPTAAELADSQVPQMEDLIYQAIDQARTAAAAGPQEALVGRVYAQLLEDPNIPASGLDEMIYETAGEMGRYGATVSDDVVEAVLTFIDELKPRLNTTNMLAAQVGDIGAEFSFLNYGKKYDIDSVLGLIFQYPKFYTESYKNHLVRLYDQPYLLSGYQKFETMINALNANLPEYYRDQLRLPDVMGQPTYMNIRALIDPLISVMDSFQSDVRERTTIGEAQVGKWVSDLNQTGMSTNSLFGILLSIVALAVNDDAEAAMAQQGYRSSVSRMSAPITAHMRRQWPSMGTEEGGLIPPGGLGGLGHPFSMAAEYVPGLIGSPAGMFRRGRQLYSGAPPPRQHRWRGEYWDQNRIGYSMAQLMDEGEISRKDATWAAYAISGDAYDTALQKHYEDRLMSTVTSFLLGRAGTRGEYQMEFNAMWDAVATIMEGKDEFPSVEAYRTAWDGLKKRWPYFDLIMMMRSAPELRDEALSWDVLSRIAPGEDEPFGVGSARNELFQELRNKFYDTRGDVIDWEHRGAWMEMMEQLAHKLDYPTPAEQAEWDEVKRGREAMVNAAQQQFGEDIVQLERDWYDGKPIGDYPPGRAQQLNEVPQRLRDYWDYKREFYARSPRHPRTAEPILEMYYGGDVTEAETVRAAREARQTQFRYHYEQQGIDIYDLRGQAAEIMQQEGKSRAERGEEYGAFMDAHPEIAESYALEEALGLRERRELPPAERQILNLVEELPGFEGIWEVKEQYEAARDADDQETMDRLKREHKLEDLWDLIRIAKGGERNTPEEEMYYLGYKLIHKFWDEEYIDEMWGKLDAGEIKYKDDPFFAQYMTLSRAAKLPDNMRYERALEAAAAVEPAPMENLITARGIAQAQVNLPENVQRVMKWLPIWMQRSLLEAYSGPAPPEIPMQFRKRMTDNYVARLPTEARVAIENLGVPRAAIERIVATDYLKQRMQAAEEPAAPATGGAAAKKKPGRWWGGGGGGGGGAPAGGRRAEGAAEGLVRYGAAPATERDDGIIWILAGDSPVRRGKHGITGRVWGGRVRGLRDLAGIFAAALHEQLPHNSAACGETAECAVPALAARSEERMKKLRVIYDGPMDEELDEKITELLESEGWHRWASGFNFVDEERDLAFEQEE
jgi:hypothetical protein